MRKLMLTVVAFAALLGGASAAAAQSYPVRPVMMIVPLATGGSTDVIARIVADGMRATLGQPVVVENVTGAGGSIGVGRVARSAPDGYTIGIGQWGTNMANGAIYPLQYDLVQDFEPIALIATQPFMIVARKTMPADNLQELIAWLKANAGKASEGNSGVGSPSHVAGILFQNTIGAKWTMVPYRSAGLSIQDLVAGQIDVMLDTPAVSGALVNSGAIKAYAVTAKKRVAAVPNLPTTDEAGLPGFYFSFWHALWAPKGTPKAIVAKLNEAVVAALADPAVRERLTALSQDIFPPAQLTPEALLAYHKAEIEKWWPVIKAAGIRAE
ncbi:MAG: tripartite tricarboxylate transporter substrate binding protein BugD [Bradyrhizobiaceae bacterium]|nr:tripartite tricarboxylate transporter substrate binding protein BugD [Bradyrhizobiaceae bacterium]